MLPTWMLIIADKFLCGSGLEIHVELPLHDPKSIVRLLIRSVTPMGHSNSQIAFRSHIMFSHTTKLVDECHTYGVVDQVEGRFCGCGIHKQTTPNSQ